MNANEVHMACGVYRLILFFLSSSSESTYLSLCMI